MIPKHKHRVSFCCSSENKAKTFSSESFVTSRQGAGNQHVRSVFKCFTLYMDIQPLLWGISVFKEECILICRKGFGYWGCWVRVLMLLCTIRKGHCDVMYFVGVRFHFFLSFILKVIIKVLYQWVFSLRDKSLLSALPWLVVGLWVLVPTSYKKCSEWFLAFQYWEKSAAKFAIFPRSFLMSKWVAVGMKSSLVGARSSFSLRGYFLCWFKVVDKVSLLCLWYPVVCICNSEHRCNNWLYRSIADSAARL